MQVTIVGRHVTVTPPIKSYIQERVARLERYDHKIEEAHVSVRVDKYRHCVEITLIGKHLRLSGQGLTNDIYTSVDTCVDRLEKQMSRRHDRVKEHALRSTRALPVLSSEEAEGAATPRVVRARRFSIKPYSVEEARLELEMMRESSFLVFRNQETGKVNVMYRMKDGNYGLIEETQR